ncbi:hypothetical protein [Streptomyces sp. SAI-041]|uniref:hypothetical protein n=1 Tax=Streptomyces sp. SAI-041 TaxID=2940548 RepID=UPI002476BA71|nr:hypothetical protein [Streptomyces sp. SAI-041]MDH6546012.1 hypothetical protein [Streptomyces sp. SAI-041]
MARVEDHHVADAEQVGAAAGPLDAFGLPFRQPGVSGCGHGPKELIATGSSRTDGGCPVRVRDA